MVTRRNGDGRVNLSSNELIHPATRGILKSALAEIDPATVIRYPVTANAIGAIADLLGLPHSEILITPGSDLAIRAVCWDYQMNHAGSGQLILQYPNYEAWEVAARATGLPVRRIEFGDDGPDGQSERFVSAAGESHGSLLAVSVPNGPGGWVITEDHLSELIRIAGERSHLLVIDSCYQAFNGSLAGRLESRGPNVLVIQTLSKSHGLAGARVAFVCGDGARLDGLGAANLEETVSGPSLQLAAYLLQSSGVFEQIWGDIRTIREGATAGLRTGGLEPLPSGGNFVTVKVGTVDDAAEVVDRLSRAGYRIKNLGSAGMGGYIRFTVGDQRVTAEVVAAVSGATVR